MKQLLAGGVLGALLGVGGTFLVAYLAQRWDLRNQYHRMLIERRVSAYDSLGEIVGMMKRSFIDTDKRTCHLIFAFGREELSKFSFSMMAVTSNNIWLSSPIVNLMGELNKIVYAAPHENDALKTFGKNHYVQVFSIRDNIENAMKDDLGDLHKVSLFLQMKKKRELLSVADF